VAAKIKEVPVGTFLATAGLVAGALALGAGIALAYLRIGDEVKSLSGQK